MFFLVCTIIGLFVLIFGAAFIEVAHSKIGFALILVAAIAIVGSAITCAVINSPSKTTAETITSIQYIDALESKAFGQVAQKLTPYTSRCVVSFIDIYRFLQPRLDPFGVRTPGIGEIMELAESFSETAARVGIEVETCSEAIDLSQYGIRKGHCIDADLISNISGRNIGVKKDQGQRAECGCVASVDIGAYNCEPNNRQGFHCHGCLYCYATRAHASNNHDAHSPFLMGDFLPGDVVTVKKNRGQDCEQQKLF